jgi:hypothetical protein
MKALSTHLFAAVAWATNGPHNMVITPFGRRLRQCVLEVESGSHIHEHGDNLLITRELDGRIISSYEHIVPAECHTDGFVEKQKQTMAEKRKAQKYQNLGESPVPDGWLDNAGAYPLGQAGNISHFSGLYTVPGDPAQDNGQVLFYFIGMQDNNYPSAVNIIQPVLTWGNGVKGWNLASWDCCPKNITVQSKTITGFGAGDQIRGTLQRQDDSTWVIDSTIVKSGANTTLVSHVGPYLYDWSDVTLEVYSTTTCPEFAKGPMMFTNLSLLGPTQNALSPSWSLTGATGCSGKITYDGKAAFNITHSQTGF